MPSGCRQEWEGRRDWFSCPEDKISEGWSLPFTGLSQHCRPPDLGFPEQNQGVRPEVRAGEGRPIGARKCRRVLRRAAAGIQPEVPGRLSWAQGLGVPIGRAHTARTPSGCVVTHLAASRPAPPKALC